MEAMFTRIRTNTDKESIRVFPYQCPKEKSLMLAQVAPQNG